MITDDLSDWSCQPLNDGSSDKKLNGAVSHLQLLIQQKVISSINHSRVKVTNKCTATVTDL